MSVSKEKPALLFELARRQAGIVTHRQLVELTFTRGEIAHRVKTGMLERVLPRTYLVAGAVWDRKAKMSAAARWAGGAISHLPAAVELGLLRLRSEPGIEVSTKRPVYKARDWIALHRTSFLPEEHLTSVAGVLLTDAERTILDLADVSHPKRVGMAIDAGLIAGKLSLESLARRTEEESRSGRGGLLVVRAELEKRDEHQSPGQSGLETTVFEILTHPSIPPFERHFKIDSGKGFALTFDLGWPAFSALGEIDDYSTHGGMEQWARDNEKTNRALELGYAVIRITRPMADKPESLRDIVSRILSQRGPL